MNEDDSGLERFLSEDLLYDVSPLPKDDEDNLSPLKLHTKEGSRETLHNEMQMLDESALDEITNPITLNIYSSSDDEKDVEKQCVNNEDSFTADLVQTQTENNMVSRSESIYYTPDNTLEKLSDVTLN